jgi:hypothetical protein
VLVYDHLSRLSIQSVKPCRRSDPKKSLRIRLYRQNLVVAQAIWIGRVMLVIQKLGRGRLKPADSGLVGHPQISFRILQEIPDVVRTAPFRPGSVPREMLALFVQFEQPVTDGTDPQRTVAVFMDSGGRP